MTRQKESKKKGTIPVKDKKDRSLQDPKDAELICAADFESHELEILFLNTTTKTMVKKGDAIRLVQLLERGMILEVPSPSCSEGHNLIVEINGVAPGRNKFRFSSTAKVSALEVLPDGSDRIVVDLVQFDDREWRELCGNFSTRQAEIEKFFEASKGRQ